MDYPWIIHGLSMDKQWTSMDVHRISRVGGTGQHILEEPLGRFWGNRSAGREQRIPYNKSKNPFRQAWLGEYEHHIAHNILLGVGGGGGKGNHLHGGPAHKCFAS